MISTPRMQLIADRLKDQVAALRDVGVVADFTAATGNLTRSPAAYVLPSGGPFKDDQVSGVTRQQQDVGFGVLLGFGNTGREGDEGIEALEPVNDAVLNALMGFKLDGAKAAIRAKRTRLVAFDEKARRLWWLLEFTFPHLHLKGA